MISETYLIVDTDGTIREAQVGQSRQSVIDDIHGFQVEAKQVLRLSGTTIQDVTAEIAQEVLDRMEKAEPSFIIPSLVEDLFPDRAEALSRASWSPEQRRADRIECDADRLREDRDERRMLEAAE